MNDQETEDWKVGDEEGTGTRNDKPKVLHPAGTFPLRVADMVKAAPGKNLADGSEYPRVTLVWLSAKRDEDGNPLWLFTTAPMNTYGGMRNGKPVGKASRFRVILEALAGHPLTDDEAKSITPSYVKGLYALGKVSHWERGQLKGAQVDSVMQMPDGMEVDIPLDSYVRPPKLGGAPR